MLTCLRRAYSDEIKVKRRSWSGKDKAKSIKRENKRSYLTIPVNVWQERLDLFKASTQSWNSKCLK